MASFQAALTAHGIDYENIRCTNAASLLLDLSVASKPRLLKNVVEDWGVIFCLWKTADAYMVAEGTKREQLRGLLKQLFFWGGLSRTRQKWPAHLTAQHVLLHREDTVASAERRALRAEAFAIRLVAALENVARELRIYSKIAHSSLKPALFALVRESEACLSEAEYLEHSPARIRGRFRAKKPGLEEARRADAITVKLAATMERAHGLLKEVIQRFRPVDAFRARRVIRTGEAILAEIVPEPKREPLYEPLRVVVFDGILYAGRLMIGFWLIPLVLALEARRRRKMEAALKELEPTRLDDSEQFSGETARSPASESVA